MLWANKSAGPEVCLTAVLPKGNLKPEIASTLKTSLVSEFYDAKGCPRRIICYLKVAYTQTESSTKNLNQLNKLITTINKEKTSSFSYFNLDNARVTRKPGNVTKEHVSPKKMLCEAHCLQSQFSNCYNMIVKRCTSSLPGSLVPHVRPRVSILLNTYLSLHSEANRVSYEWKRKQMTNFFQCQRHHLTAEEMELS